MTKRRQKAWVYTPPRRSKPKVPDSTKMDLETKAEALVENVLKPGYVEPPPEAMPLNYIADIYTKWYRNYFYFCAEYRRPGRDAASPSFEAKFARLEYVGNDRFNLSFWRHTGQWVELYTDLSVDECLAAVRDDPWFHP